jgi:hypothetical protein
VSVVVVSVYGFGRVSVPLVTSECVGAWVRGCVGAWVRGLVGAWVRGCASVVVVSVYGFVRVDVSGVGMSMVGARRIEQSTKIKQHSQSVEQTNTNTKG